MKYLIIALVTLISCTKQVEQTHVTIVNNFYDPIIEITTTDKVYSNLQVQRGTSYKVTILVQPQTISVLFSNYERHSYYISQSDFEKNYNIYPQ